MTRPEKRKIDDTFADVWATMLYEKIDHLEELKRYAYDGTEKGAMNYARYCAEQNGLCQALALFQCLESGRYKKRWDEITVQLELERQRENEQKGG